MKKTRLLASIVLVLGVGYVGSAWFIGQKVESMLREYARDADNITHQQMTVSVEDYKRSLFSSTATLKVKSKSLDLLVESDEDTDLYIELEIAHGPFPSIMSGQLTPALAKQTATLRKTAWLTGAFAAFKGGSPISVDSIISFTGNMSGEVSIASAQVDRSENPMDGLSTHVTFEGGKGTFFYNRAQTTVQTKLNLGRFSTVQKPVKSENDTEQNTRFTVGSILLDVNELSRDGWLSFGDSTFEIKDISYKNEALPEGLDLAYLRFTSNVQEQGSNLNQLIQFAMGDLSMTSAELKLSQKASDFTSDLKGLDKKSINTYIERAVEASQLDQTNSGMTDQVAMTMAKMVQALWELTASIESHQFKANIGALDIHVKTYDQADINMGWQGGRIEDAALTFDRLFLNVIEDDKPKIQLITDYKNESSLFNREGKYAFRYAIEFKNTRLAEQTIADISEHVEIGGFDKKSLVALLDQVKVAIDETAHAAQFDQAALMAYLPKMQEKLSAFMQSGWYINTHHKLSEGSQEGQLDTMVVFNSLADMVNNPFALMMMSTEQKVQSLVQSINIKLDMPKSLLIDTGSRLASLAPEAAQLSAAQIRETIQSSLDMFVGIGQAQHWLAAESVTGDALQSHIRYTDNKVNLNGQEQPLPAVMAQLGLSDDMDEMHDDESVQPEDLSLLNADEQAEMQQLTQKMTDSELSPEEEARYDVLLYKAMGVTAEQIKEMVDAEQQ